jgi:biotin carboxyl carrier protein
VTRYSVKAPVGGSVWTHAASVGQRVVAGTTILICEVMKCEYPIETPVDGIVTWLKPCGDTIEAEDVVAELEVA